ncbi:MAG TPA: hypothetical protein VIK93_03895 [Limnochordales bacterium]
MARRVVSWERYQQIQKWSADYAEALVRTNLAVRCWLRRLGGRTEPVRLAAALSDSGQVQRADRDGLSRRDRYAQPALHTVFAWLVCNQMRQAFYRSYGIDVVPWSEGVLRGSAMAVQTAEGCKGKEPERLAIIGVEPLRVEPARAGVPSLDILALLDHMDDPLWVVDAAAVHAVGGRWPRHCHRRSCPHRRDAVIYLTVSQIVTLLLCMGHAQEVALTAPVRAGTLDNTGRLAHAAEEAPGAGFAERCFAVRLAAGNGGCTVRVHGSTGQLVAATGELIPFDTWCGGDVEQGLRFLCGMAREHL